MTNVSMDIQKILKKMYEAEDQLYDKQENVMNNVFKKTLFTWIKELLDIFLTISDTYEMENYLNPELEYMINYLDSKLKSVLTVNDNNLYLHYSMLINKLEDFLKQDKELQKETKLLELIAEIKRCEDDVL